jgi:peptidoglycan-associated lipoprotein
MKKRMVALLAVVSMVALLAGGCSSNSEAVKKDAASVPATTAPVVEKAVEPAKPVQPVEEVKKAEPAKIVENVREEASSQKEAKSEPAKAVAAAPKFETVYFDFDKSDLRQDARDVLSKNAETILKSLAGAKIQIEGHCDERGSAEYNLALGERRAKSVQKYLTTLGVKGDSLSIISYGKEKPAVMGSDEAAWAKNRRAEFVIVK